MEDTNSERLSAATRRAESPRNTKDESGELAAAPCSAGGSARSEQETEKVNVMALIDATNELSSLSGRSKPVTYSYIRSYVVSGKDSKYSQVFSTARLQNQRIHRRLENLRASYLGHQKYGQLHLKLPSSLEYNQGCCNQGNPLTV